MKSFLSFITPIIIILSICGPFFYFSFIRKELEENKLEKTVDQEVIKGNKVAIAMRRSSRFVYFKDKDLIIAALEGNKSAIEALRIEIREEKK